MPVTAYLREIEDLLVIQEELYRALPFAANAEV